RIARTAEADVVREDSCAENVAVAMNGVDAVKQRDAESRLLRARLKAVVVIGPIDEAVAGFRIGTAAAQDGAEKIGFNVARIFKTRRISLDHLAHFFFERHA